MATCTVSGTSIDKNTGPGFLETKLAAEDIQAANNTWNVARVHAEHETVFTATPNAGVVVTGQQLQDQVKQHINKDYYQYSNSN